MASKELSSLSARRADQPASGGRSLPPAPMSKAVVASSRGARNIISGIGKPAHRFVARGFIGNGRRPSQDPLRFLGREDRFPWTIKLQKPLRGNWLCVRPALLQQITQFALRRI